MALLSFEANLPWMGFLDIVLIFCSLPSSITLLIKNMILKTPKLNSIAVLALMSSLVQCFHLPQWQKCCYDIILQHCVKAALVPSTQDNRCNCPLSMSQSVILNDTPSTRVTCHLLLFFYNSTKCAMVSLGSISSRPVFSNGLANYSPAMGCAASFSVSLPLAGKLAQSWSFLQAYMYSLLVVFDCGNW